MQIINDANNTCMLAPVLFSVEGKHFLFHTKFKEFKQSKKRMSGKTSKFIENDFFDESKSWLQSAPEGKKQLNLDKLTRQKIATNFWSLTAGGKVTTSDNKERHLQCVT